MAHDLTRVRSSARAVATASGSRSATRAQAVSSADDVSWAWRPQRSDTTSSRAGRGARSVRWCRAIRHAPTWAHVSVGPGTRPRLGVGVLLEPTTDSARETDFMRRNRRDPDSGTAPGADTSDNAASERLVRLKLSWCRAGDGRGLHEVAGVEGGQRRRLGRGEAEADEAALAALVHVRLELLDPAVTLGQGGRRSHEPAASTTRESKTSSLRPAVSARASWRRSTAARRRSRREGSTAAWCSRWARPKATWRASSWRARRETWRVTASGAWRSRKASRLRKLPSPSTDRRNEAREKSGSASRVASDARPPAPEMPMRPSPMRARRVKTSTWRASSATCTASSCTTSRK